jgi:hypothetical protein
MNTLPSTILFKEAIEKFTHIKGILNSKSLEEYAVPDSYYNHYYKIFENKKYSLTKYMLKLAREGRIKLVNFSDPISLKSKPCILPSYFTVIAGKGINNSKLTMYSNSIKKGGFKRNSKTEEIESFSIQEMALFGYLYSAASAYIINTKGNILENNTKFVSICAEMYTSLINRCIIGKQYPIGSNIDDVTLLNFITIMFFLQFFIGYSVERALNTALKIKIIDPAVIKLKSYLYTHNDLEIANFNQYTQALEKEFSYIRPGTITLRSIAYNFQSFYGDTSLFGVEHFQSLINMMLNAHIGTGIYYDLLIKKTISSNLIAEVDKILLSATISE